MSDRDLIERLRSPYVKFDDDRPLAADRLEALSAENEAVLAANKDCLLHFDVMKTENERFRAALHRIEDGDDNWQLVATQALKGANNG
jgi:hypothetical protein